MDLGTYTLKAIQVEQSRSGYKVVRSAEVPTPPEAVAGGQVVPGPALVIALQALRQKIGGGRRDVAVAIPANLALVRRLPMPRVPPKRVRALLETQGQQFIPFYRDGATFDFVITNPNLNANEQEILLVAVPTVVVERLQAAIRTAGFKLAALDIDAIALYRAGVALGQVPANIHTAVLDVGHRRARVGLFYQGWPTILRTMDVLPLLPSEAEPPEDARFMDPEEFAIELRRTTEILLSQSRPDDALGALLVSARWQSQGLNALLEEEMRAGGRTGPDFLTVGAGGQAIPPGFTLAFGLAVAQIAAPARLTLLPRPPMDVMKQRRLAMLVFFVSLLGAGAYGFFWYQQAQYLSAEEARLNKVIADHTAYLSKTEPAVRALEGKVAEYASLQAAYSTSEPWSVFYPHLRSLLPIGVELQTISLTGDSLTLTGTATTPEVLAEFVQRLHTSPMVVPPILHTYADTGGAFSISSKVRPRRGGSK